jgi:hypothetical protein
MKVLILLFLECGLRQVFSKNNISGLKPEKFCFRISKNKTSYITSCSEEMILLI